MSQILKSLSKVQESRQGQQDPKIAGTLYLANEPPVWFKTAWMIIPAAGAMGAILISILAIMLMMTKLGSQHDQVSVLERTVKIQDIRINEVITLLKETKSHSDHQILDLDLRFIKETQNMNFQINSLASAFKDTYKFMLSNRN